ncbi:MAG: trigger factor [Acidobacteriota bacterium]
MSVVTGMEEAGPHRVKLTIEVPAQAVDAEMGRVMQEFRREVRLPGFRKGKVPKRLLQKRFNDEIQREVADRLLPRYWQQAQAEKDLDPLLPPTVDDLTLNEGEPMVVVATVETRPDITLGDIENFDLPDESTDPNDDEIDDAIADLRRSFAEWNTVEREAGTGDLVVGTMLDLDAGGDDAGEADGDEEVAEAAPAPEPRPMHIEIGAANTDEELSLLLTGKAAGATVIYERTHGEGEEESQHRYEIQVNEIKEQELPEVDDAFAERLGIGSSDELRTLFEQRIRGEKEQSLRRRRTEILLEALRERHPLPTLPEGVVQQEAERMMREQADQMAQQGVDLENAGIDWGQMLDSIRPAAERRVHERLVLDAIAKDQGSRLDEEKFEMFLSSAAAQQNVSSLALRQRLSEDGRLEPLRAQLLREQTIAELLGEGDSVSDDEDDSDDDV